MYEFNSRPPWLRWMRVTGDQEMAGSVGRSDSFSFIEIYHEIEHSLPFTD